MFAAVDAASRRAGGRRCLAEHRGESERRAHDSGLGSEHCVEVPLRGGIAGIVLFGAQAQRRQRDHPVPAAGQRRARDARELGREDAALHQPERPRAGERRIPPHVVEPRDEHDGERAGRDGKQEVSPGHQRALRVDEHACRHFTVNA